jgi:hypothetical protein
MSANVDRRLSEQSVEEVIARLDAATNPREIEMIADQLRVYGDNRAIEPLLHRLGDERVQSDPDVEDAVCRALMALGVMCSSGKGRFSLRPRGVLSDDAIEAIGASAGLIPWRYFGTARS